MNTYPNQQRTNKEFTLAAGDTHVANFVDARKGLPFNSATIEQLQKPNYVTSTVASIAGAQVYAPYSDIQGEKRAQSPSTSGRGDGVRGLLDSHQPVVTFETQNDHLQEHTSGQILKQVQDDNIMRGRIVKQKKLAFRHSSPNGGC